MMNYVLTMTDKTKMEIVAEDMKQSYGFLIFTDENGEQNIGIRAELVREWQVEPVTPQPARVRRSVKKVSR